MLLWALDASFSGKYRDSARRRPALILSKTLHMLVSMSQRGVVHEDYDFDWLYASVQRRNTKGTRNLPFCVDKLDSLAT